MKKFFLGKTAMAMAVAAATGAAVMPMAVFAENVPTAKENAVQDAGKEVWTTTDAKGTGSWGTDDGQVELTYDTTGGQWIDSADVKHNNGTYVVRIPKSIKYANMHVGAVSTSNDYNVTVEGVLASGKSVSVSAETGKAIAFNGTPANDKDKISEVTSMKGTDTSNTEGAYSDTNKRTFTAEQVSNMDDAGKVSGKTVQDNISMSGKAFSAGTYTGTVQYSAALIGK